MRHLAALLVPAAGAALLAFAAPRASPPAHDVQWFIDHEDVDAEVSRACRNNPGQLRDDPNCINAEKAWTGITLKHADEAFAKPARGGKK